jgi:hypothetical protein
MINGIIDILNDIFGSTDQEMKISPRICYIKITYSQNAAILKKIANIFPIKCS